jgi:hypothetical protein
MLTPTAALALIQPSAWKRNSRKSISKILYSHGPNEPESRRHTPRHRTGGMRYSPTALGSWARRCSLKGAPLLKGGRESKPGEWASRRGWSRPTLVPCYQSGDEFRMNLRLRPDVPYRTAALDDRTGAMGFLVNFFSGLCSTKFRGVDKVRGPRSDVPALNPVATDR